MSDLFDLQEALWILVFGTAGGGRRLMVRDGDDVARRPGVRKVPLRRRRGRRREVRKQRDAPRAARRTLRRTERRGERVQDTHKHTLTFDAESALLYYH